MTLLSANQIAYIFCANDKSQYLEWSRPFGLDVLVWGLDPIYNVFS